MSRSSFLHTFYPLSGLPRRRCRRQRVPGHRGQGRRRQRADRPRHDGLSGGADRGLQPQLLPDLGGGGGGVIGGGGGGGGEADGLRPDEAAVGHPAQHGAPQPGRTNSSSGGRDLC